VKNVIVLAGPTAGLKLFDAPYVWLTLGALLSFCLAAGAIYCFNDVLDRKADAVHPTKRHRPVARGAIRESSASAFGVLLAVGAVLIASLAVNRRTAVIVLLYILLMAAYSLFLKRMVILDVLVLATGFVLRAWGGAAAAGVSTSEWLIACVFTLCLFLGFGKRRCEVVSLSDAAEAEKHRETLIRYTPDLLNHLITVSAGIAVVTFLLYTLEISAHPAPFRKEYLFYTLPIVVYGVFRFAMLTETGLYAGPTEIVLKDRMMRACVLLWGIIALIVVYYQPIAERISG
jgi:4-hydroxybenzoate polyprenyltransferase